ncbi:MmcQ/YjbR family DNA-binding protein [Specibacter cremeus]|uniref:MmcQ/YjbR family DNA-binding protein n=1 Tax=Specibacter cremeus TaxID=1629051 RepID=UPI001F0C1440|nr:MmcQ/YjbR family DNA-binding protein [Specibacter cremeus]
MATTNDDGAHLDGAGIRAAALALPGVYEDFPFGPETSVFKVVAPVTGGAARVGKVFAIAGLDTAPLSVALKCDPELAPQLRLANPGITPGYHLNKRHWNSVDCSLVERSLVLDMLEDSWDLVVAGLPRTQREALGWAARLRG